MTSDQRGQPRTLELIAEGLDIKPAELLT